MASISDLAGKGMVSENNMAPNSSDEWDGSYENENMPYNDEPDYGDYGYDDYGYDNGGQYGYDQPQLPPEYYEEEPSRAWDIHYTPSWFVEEQQNRLNPNYEPDSRWENETVDAVANYVKGWQESQPKDWRYGDPGWDTSNGLWRETIQPQENQYQEEQRRIQLQEQAQLEQQRQNPQKGEEQSQFYSGGYFAVQGSPNNTSPSSQEAVERVNNDPRFRSLNSIQYGNEYDEMSHSGKLNYNFMPAQAGTDVKNAPVYSRWTQPLFTSAMSAAGPANLLKLGASALIGGPWGAVAYVAGALGTFAYTYGKQMGWWQGNRAVDKIIELTDILDDKGAQLQGAFAYAWEKIGGDDLTRGGITDIGSSISNAKYIFDNFGDFMHYAFGSGKASTEYDSDVVGIVGKLVPNMGANFWGSGQNVSRWTRNILSQLVDDPEDKIWLQRGQTTRNNLALEGVYEIPEEMQGSDAYMYWLSYAQALKDAGITDEAELEYWVSSKVNEVYGDLSNYSEFLEHEFGDLGNTAEGMQSRGMNVYGHVVNSPNLVQAAQHETGSIAMDLAGNIPSLPFVSAQNLISTVGRAFGKEIKSSGGIDEVLGEWNNINITGNPNDLKPIDRRYSRIDSENRLKEFNPNKDPNTVKNPFQNMAERVKNFFSTTNEWKATMSGDAIFAFIDSGIEMAMQSEPDDNPEQVVKRLNHFMDELQTPEKISEGSPFYTNSQSVLFNTIKDDLATAVRTKRPEINKVIQEYADLEPNRQTLNKIADAIGLSPAEVMDKYNNQKALLTQLIISKADENGGKIPDIKDINGNEIDVESRDFGDRVMSMLKPFAGNEGKAYDPRLVMTQITSKVADGVTDTLTTKYNIKPEGWVFRFGETVKKMQHLWLLGLSPSYLANNIANNVLTRSALGYGGFLSDKSINSWYERFGYKPERFEESTIAEALETDTKKPDSEKTKAERMREAIADRKRGKDIFATINKGSDWVSQHAGIFGNISGWVESNETKQIMASSMMTYMARTWKQGVNYRKMSPQLENLIRSQNPDMLDAIYSAINSGMNMEEIEKAIYGTYVFPNVEEVLVTAAKNVCIDDSE